MYVVLTKVNKGDAYDLQFFGGRRHDAFNILNKLKKDNYNTRVYKLDTPIGENTCIKTVYDPPLKKD